MLYCLLESSLQSHVCTLHLLVRLSFKVEQVACCPGLIMMLVAGKTTSVSWQLSCLSHRSPRSRLEKTFAKRSLIPCIMHPLRDLSSPEFCVKHIVFEPKIPDRATARWHSVVTNSVSPPCRLSYLYSNVTSVLSPRGPMWDTM